MNMNETTNDKPLRILVADDESHILNVVALKLRGAGYEVTCCGDGEEAFESAQSQRPDLLITDYHMPKVSGIELCQKLNGDAQASGGEMLPAIMLTARGYDIPSEQLLGCGIIDVVSKPFSPRQLLERVRQLLPAA